jgi:uncharacterized damage-inducible protein DinB
MSDEHRRDSKENRPVDVIALIRRLHQHRRWVNDKLLAVAEQLSDEQLRNLFEIGQGSIWKSLLHLYAAEYVWVAALTGDEDPLTPGDARGKLPGNQEGTDAMSSLSELRAQWANLDERWDDYLAKLKPESLDEIVYKTSTSSGVGKRHVANRADVLLHVCTHAQYTVAQIINMMRHVRVDQLPDPMLISLAREETVAQQELEQP